MPGRECIWESVLHHGCKKPFAGKIPSGISLQKAAALLICWKWWMCRFPDYQSSGRGWKCRRHCSSSHLFAPANLSDTMGKFHSVEKVTNVSKLIWEQRFHQQAFGYCRVRYWMTGSMNYTINSKEISKIIPLKWWQNRVCLFQSFKFPWDKWHRQSLQRKI